MSRRVYDIVQKNVKQQAASRLDPARFRCKTAHSLSVRQDPQSRQGSRAGSFIAAAKLSCIALYLADKLTKCPPLSALSLRCCYLREMLPSRDISTSCHSVAAHTLVHICAQVFPVTVQLQGQGKKSELLCIAVGHDQHTSAPELAAVTMMRRQMVATSQ